MAFDIVHISLVYATTSDHADATAVTAKDGALDWARASFLTVERNGAHDDCAVPERSSAPT